MLLCYYTLYLFHYQKGGGAGGAGGGGAECDLDIIRDQGISAKRTPSTWFMFWCGTLFKRVKGNAFRSLEKLLECDWVWKD